MNIFKKINFKMILILSILLFIYTTLCAISYASYTSKDISDSVFRQIAERVAKKEEGIYSVSRIRVENYGEGISIYMEAVINYGDNIINILNDFKNKLKKEIEKQTAMNVLKVDLVAKGIHMEEK